MERSIIYLSTFVFLLVFACDKETAQQHEGHDTGHEGMLTLTDQERVTANIRIDTAKIKALYQETTLTGTAAVDERAINLISARVKGRVDKLFARNPGSYITSGEPLYSIYSEDLLVFANEYLLAIDESKTASTQKAVTQRMVDGARRRLELLTLSEKQIKALETTKNISPLITFYSNRSGHLSDLLVREGEYIDVGTPMFRLANLNDLWIESQLYSNEINLLRQAPVLEVEFESSSGERIKGEIVYQNPRLEENTKINLLRVKINNAEGKYRPGMMAYVYLKRNEKETLVIPKSALLVGTFTTVWVETPEGMFEPRMVETGISNKREVEILSGLSPGDLVVSSGAYLLNSEWKVKQGGSSMEGMDM
jgi:membrane fusion protein, copper/silver efflux system